jgi:Rhs element Vgr protein
MPEDFDINEMPDDDDNDDGIKEASVFADAVDIKLTIGGEKVDYEQKIMEVTLEQSVYSHHVARVLVQEDLMGEGDYVLATSKKYSDLLGKTFSMKVEADIANEPHPVNMSFNGVIGNIEFRNSIDGLYIIAIVAYSPTILMDGAPKNAFYFDKKASDIIGSLASNYPITKGKQESTPNTMKYCVQYRETDYNFIMRLASHAGLFSFYTGQEFQITKANSDQTIELHFPSTLGWFTLDLGAKPYEYSTVVYNYAQKKNYVQDSKSITQQAALSDSSQLAANASKELYKDSGFTQQASTIEDAKSLDKVLSLKRSQAMGRLITAKGQSGNPTVVPGCSIKISHMGHMNGDYWVTRVKHVYRGGMFYNTFECVPVDLAFPRPKSARPTITNVQTAVVVDNNDPDQLGRVKVKFPWLETAETPWVRYVTSHAGKDRGWYALPEIGDEVLVGYEQGSPDLPIALGAMYNKDNAPLSDVVNPDNNVKAFITKSGNKIVLTDEDGKEKVEIVTKDGKNLITMQTGGPTVIESEGAINIKGGEDIVIEGANITLDSKGEVKIKAATNTNFEAGVNSVVKAGAQLQIEGMTVTVKGTPIQLN